MFFLLKDDPFSSKQILLYRRLFIITHVFLPLLFIVPIFTGFHWGNWDILISTFFYDFTNHKWIYKNFWVIQKLFHIGGRILFFTIIAGILLLLVNSFKSGSGLKNYRRNLAYLLVASIAGPIIIIILKSKSAIYCPWELQLFGGLKPHIHLLETLDPRMNEGHCFPAAHAGSGFAFVSLYFFFLTTQAKNRFYGLSFGLSLGGVYGATQQMSGAHFFSHDVFALAICWYTSLFFFLLFFRKQFDWI
ncbi:MAG TPA: phosphatase PAP2 family protein [Methylobacter sp.]|jgi:membrane-associated PAP2 superfamily phosphatase